MQAIILAGGLGTRLKQVVPDVPKPMALINGRPFLCYVLDNLLQYHFSKVVLTVGHLHTVISDYFGDHYQGLALEYSLEIELLGTGGAIKQAFHQIDADHCFVLNGDTFIDLNFQAMANLQQATQSELCMAVVRVPDVVRYGGVVLQNDYVTEFSEKGKSGSGFINAGVYLMSKQIFATMELPTVFSFEKDFLVPSVHSIKPRAFITTGYFIDIGVPEDFYLAQKTLVNLSEKISK